MLSVIRCKVSAEIACEGCHQIAPAIPHTCELFPVDGLQLCQLNDIGLTPCRAVSGQSSVEFHVFLHH